MNGAFSYHLVGGSGALAINPQSGWLTVANQSLLDREEFPVINLRVCADQLAPLTVRDARAYTPAHTEKPKTPAEEPKTPVEEVNTPVEEFETTTEELEVTTPTEYLRGLEDITEATTLHDDTGEGATIQVATTELPETTVWEGLYGTVPTLMTAPLLREVGRPRGSTKGRGFTEMPPVKRQRIPLHGRRRRTKRNSEGTRGGYSSLTKRETTAEVIRDEDLGARRGDGNVRVLLRVQRIDPNSTNTRKETPEGDITNPEEDTTSPLESEATQGHSQHKPPSGAFQWGETRRRGHRSTNTTQKEEGDASVPQSWSCVRIELNLLDANDNNPVFLPTNQHSFTITENARPGDLIGSVSEGRVVFLTFTI